MNTCFNSKYYDKVWNKINYDIFIQKKPDAEKDLQKCHLKCSPCEPNNKKIFEDSNWKSFRLLSCKIMQMADSALVSHDADTL